VAGACGGDCAKHVAFDGDTALMHERVMTPAEQHQVVERGRTAIGPVIDVVSVAATGRAAREAAAGIL